MGLSAFCGPKRRTIFSGPFNHLLYLVMFGGKVISGSGNLPCPA
jgi:hypothetical protein